jgi:hypothetical protein
MHMPELRQELIQELVEQESLLVKHPAPRPQPEPPTIHYTQLAEAPPDSPIAAEWNFYCREVGRLLAEGHEGKWLLIKGEQIVGIFDSHEEACEKQGTLIQPVMIKQVLKREPVLRIGYIPPCRS